MATATTTGTGKLESLLGSEAQALLEHKCETVPKEVLNLPGPDFVERIWVGSDRPTRVLRSLESLVKNGRLEGTGYVSILPVDPGMEHSAGAAFPRDPARLDADQIAQLATEGGCD